jgi:glutathione S-transferase
MTGEAQVKLHWLNGSRAQSILWLLEELEIPYELDIHHRQKDMLAPPSLRKLHPLGKSPLVSVTTPGATEPFVLAESGFIVQYLCDHFPKGKELVPQRWKEGQENKLGGETEEWMRYQYLLYYIEGSFMFTLVLHFILSSLKGPNVPFFIRPVTSFIANQMIAMVVIPNMKRHFGMMEQYLATSPKGGKYMCGPSLTGADILLGYPLLAGKDGAFDAMATWEKGSFKETFPNLHAYMGRLSEEAGWKKSVAKIESIEGSFSILPATTKL